MRRSLALISVVLAVALLSLPAAAHACPGANSHPSTLSNFEALVATFCLVNRERTNRGLRPLSGNLRLVYAAQGHANDMVRRRYFSHTSPGGSTPASRISRTGYMTGARWWSVGENIAW